jgi:hypothetical protein
MMFTLVFLMSYIPEMIPQAFNDYMCQGGKLLEANANHSYWAGCSYHTEPSKHWGFRHWIWFAASFTFAVWTVIDVIADSQKIKSHV